MNRNKIHINELFFERFEDLIRQGEEQWNKFQKNGTGLIEDPIEFSQWSTSCLNLLDKLSVSTNRFVTQFEEWILRSISGPINLGAALGVLKSAKEEYALGLAIEYHLSVSATVFNGLLDEAEYLIKKKYLRAAAVLIGAALEEGLKNRAKTEGIEIPEKDNRLNPVIIKLKSSNNSILTAFEAKELEVCAKMRNDAAHGGNFSYEKKQVEEQLRKVREILDKLLRTR
ncbi:MAG: hypothetical protein MI739_01590 [Bacteroidales bacterium]|nr:hypothetical protein [Bacteroidales bacterium]